MTFSLATFVLAAIPYCEGTTDVQKCAQWMANDMMLEQAVRPGHELNWYLEGASERIPGDFWPEDL